MVAHCYDVQLVKAYQDVDFVYILLEMVQGGELFSILHADEEMSGLPEHQAKFYALGVADALAYMVRSFSIDRLTLTSLLWSC